MPPLLEKAYRRARQMGRMTVARLFGTQSTTSGKYLGVMDLEERAIYCRAEVSALVALLIKKNLFTQAQFHTQLIEELNHLADLAQQRFPEIEFTEVGTNITDPQAYIERAKREGWPP